MSDEFTARERLELAIGMVERMETLRANIANRSGLILSTNAILFAGEGIILSATQGLADEKGPIFLLLMAALVAQTISAFYALAMMGYIWSQSDKLGIPPDDRIFFHSSSTRKAFMAGKNMEDAYQEFKNAVANVSIDKMLTSATSEWWNGLHAHGIRYKYMRYSTYLITLSLVLFTSSLILLMVGQLI